MKIRLNLYLFSLSLLFAILIEANISYAQEEIEKEKMEQYKEEVKQMVSFLQFSLNVLGDPSISAKDKDVIINESYLKIFIDGKVQIEDDLVENRDVVTNKDVQAYLKDVDFFFKGVKFDFNIIEIVDDLNPEGNLFFTVKMMRSLTGITVEDDSINSDQERYIEVNVDEENKDLRIASIYTTKLSRNDELTIWWSGLADEWKTLLGLDIEVKEGLRLNEIQEFSDTTYWADDILFTDSINIIDFVKIAAGKEEINLSGSSIITDLKPLDQLKSLKSLDISSSDINDLFPIRNLTTIEMLNCSNTMVENLAPLKYSKSLRKLYINNTPISSITVIENFENLELLHMEHTVIDSLPSVSRLSHLKDLNCSSTNLEHLDSVRNLYSLENLNISNTIVEDLEPIANLKNLRSVNLSRTNTKSLEPISKLQGLEEIIIENTEVSSLNPLQNLDRLKVIYADESKIDLEDFTEFSKVKPNVDVVFMTEELVAFWKNIDVAWVDILQDQLQFSDSITADQIHDILKISALDIQKGNEIRDLQPVKYMPLLASLDFTGTSITDLNPLRQNSNLKVLRGSGSQVIDLSPIQSLSNLEVIDFNNTSISHIAVVSELKNLDTISFNNTQVKNIDALNDIPDFSIAYFDNSQVTDQDVYTLNYDEEKSIVVYKSEKLRAWWGNMDDHWQDIFREMNNMTDRPSSIELHKLAGKRKLDVQGTSIKNLDPIPEFIRLNSLSFSDTRISSLYPLTNMRVLKELKCSRNPIDDITALTPIESLEKLDLDNTQIKEIKGLQSLTNLKELKFSGTMVKDISPIEGMQNLEVLEFSKTRVKQVNALASLNNLKVLKCYNNKISEKKMEEFKMKNPGCEVVFY